MCAGGTFVSRSSHMVSGDDNDAHLLRKGIANGDSSNRVPPWVADSRENRTGPRLAWPDDRERMAVSPTSPGVATPCDDASTDPSSLAKLRTRMPESLLPIPCQYCEHHQVLLFISSLSVLTVKADAKRVRRWL